ncbi:50S ribosomal protein L35ae [archaeon]|nr:50S ribosomal protein L35ae [archaeon]
MEAVIVNFRGSQKHKYTNQMIIQANLSKDKAKELVGKKIIWTSPGKKKKEIKGEIKRLHGNSGALRVKFETGMPGQSIGQKVKIE